jgi:hypothetical protein
MSDIPDYMRIDNETGRLQIVSCPYDWIPLNRANFGESTIQINRENMVKQAIDLDIISCIGDWCAIYPCERVRDFSEGKI